MHLPSTLSSSHEYQIIITTGVWRNSGTTAKVAIEIYGTEESTGIIQLNLDDPGVNNFLFTRGNTDVKLQTSSIEVRTKHCTSQTITKSSNPECENENNSTVNVNKL